MKVAEERRFKDYRTDDALDVRQVKVALRRLRQLTRSGQETELDLDETIDETCRNAGEIELVFRAPRRNNVRLLLLMDVGGTMDPYYEPVSRLLTALHEEHGLREFQPYYFHNCVYDHLYTKRAHDARRRGADRRRAAQARQPLEVRHRRRRRHAPRRAARAVRQHRPAPARSPTQGIVWLHRIAEHFDRSVWINPEDTPYWDGSHTAPHHPPPLPDVPPERRRPRPGDAGAGRREDHAGGVEGVFHRRDAESAEAVRLDLRASASLR